MNSALYILLIWVLEDDKRSKFNIKARQDELNSYKFVDVSEEIGSTGWAEYTEHRTGQG